MRTELMEAETDVEALAVLRELTELSAALSTLENTNQNLQSQLQKRCQHVEGEGGEQGPDSGLKAAMVLSRANSKLRTHLAEAFERKRQQLIRVSTNDSASALSARLENAFQMDWFASYHNLDPSAFEEVESTDREIMQLLGGHPILDQLQNLKLDEERKKKIEQALHASVRILESRTRELESGERRQTFTNFIGKPAILSRYHYGFSTEEGFDPEPYSFDEEQDDKIVITTSGSGNEEIKCGSLDKLIERLTDDRFQDLNLRFVFLLTYHSFTTAEVLLEKLVHRYFMPNPPNSTPNEVEFFKKNRQKGVRLKVFSVLKKWVEDHYSDFEENDRLRNRLRWLLCNKLADQPWSKKLTGTILSVITKQESGGTRMKALSMTCPTPEIRSSITLDDLKNSFADVSCLEIARQLCVSDFDMFKQIRPRECLNQAWSKADKNERAPNIMRMIRRFNHVSHFTQFEILHQGSTQLRLAMLRKLIRIAHHCLVLNNFTSACAIFSGLEATAVHRLKNIWEQLGSKHRAFFESLSDVFRHDTKSKMRFRTILQEAIPPCIPHLGLFLSDLTFIEDGNPDTLHGLINFSKRRKLSERIMWIKQYQQAGYQLQRLDIVHEFFQKVLLLRDEDQLWKMSKAIQP